MNNILEQVHLSKILIKKLLTRASIRNLPNLKAAVLTLQLKITWFADSSTIFHVWFRKNSMPTSSNQKFWSV